MGTPIHKLNQLYYHSGPFSRQNAIFFIDNVVPRYREILMFVCLYIKYMTVAVLGGLYTHCFGNMVGEIGTVVLVVSQHC